MLTISQFAERTGISPSALRFYDRKGLLPAQRRTNGYRAWRRDQIATAQLLSSLRQAGVGIADIRRFLRQGADGRAALLTRWQHEAAARLLTIRLATGYLDGLRRAGPQIHLSHWHEPSVVVWRDARAPAGALPFRQQAEHARRELRRHGVRIVAGAFARTTDLDAGEVVGEVGFRVAPRGRRPIPATFRREPVPPTMFATLECTADDEQAAHRVFERIDELGCRPLERHLERYLPGEPERYQLMIAVAPRA